MTRRYSKHPPRGNFCGSCGRRIDGVQRFCGNCGADISPIDTPAKSGFSLHPVAVVVLAFVGLLIIGGIGQAINGDDSQPAQVRQAGSISVTPTQVALLDQAVTPGPSPEPTPPPPEPKALDPVLFLVNMDPMPCYQDADPAAKLVARHKIGVVQLVDTEFDSPTGYYYRESTHQCWNRVSGLPFKTFSTKDEAEAFAKTIRLPVVGQTVTLPSDGWKLTVVSVQKERTARTALNGTTAALGIYLRITIMMENTAKEAHTLGANRFQLTDSEGRKYDVYVYLPEVGSRINPSLAGTGEIWFDVPPNAEDVLLTSLGGFKVSLGNVASIR